MNAVGGVAGKGNAWRDESAGKREAKWEGAARTDGADRPEFVTEATLKLFFEDEIVGRNKLSASAVRSVHTSDERLPLSGRMAKGPEAKSVLPRSHCAAARAPRS